jgi:hypothetical protein
MPLYDYCMLIKSFKKNEFEEMKERVVSKLKGIINCNQVTVTPQVEVGLLSLCLPHVIQELLPTFSTGIA